MPFPLEGPAISLSEYKEITSLWADAEAAAREEDGTAADRVGLVVEKELAAAFEGPGSGPFFPFAFVNLGEEGASIATGGGGDGFGRA